MIAPAVGHVIDLIDERTGWTADPTDVVSGLRIAMLAALEDPEEAKRRGMAARATVAKQNWDDIGAELEAIYWDYQTQVGLI